MQRFVRHGLFVFVASVIVVVGSERMFWYWAESAQEHLVGAAFYSVCTAAFLAVLRRFEVHSLWGVVAALPIFAYVTEGVITPVLYSGGPTPFFPLWFTGWHGLLSVFVLLIVVRRLAIGRRVLAMTGLSVLLGGFWGTWLITSTLPSQLDDPELVEAHGQLSPMLPADFAGYAMVFTAFLLGAHLLLDLVWPRDPGRLFVRTDRLLAVVVVLGAAGWTMAAPWAVPMFVGLCWLQIRMLRRHRDQRPVGRPTLLDAMAGPASRSALVPLLLMAPVAALTYWGWWSIGLPEHALNGIYFGTIFLQTAAAAVLLVMTWRRTRRPAADPDREPNHPSAVASWPPPAAPVHP